MPKSNFKINEIALVFIVALAAVIVSIYDRANTPPAELEAEKITAMILDEGSIGFVSGGMVDEAKLRELQTTDYGALKKHFNVKNDFCVYIEDESGEVILAKGSSKLNRDGLYCKE